MGSPKDQLESRGPEFKMMPAIFSRYENSTGLELIRVGFLPGDYDRRKEEQGT